MRRIPFLALALILALLGAVSPVWAQNVAELQVTPETVTLRVGQKQSLFATAFDANGNLIPTAKFTYVSSDPALVKAQVDGVVIGLKIGAASVRVAAGQRSVTVPVTVEGAVVTLPPPDTTPTRPPGPAGPPPTVLNIEPTTVYLLPSENRRLSLKAFNADGSAADATRATWKSLTPSIATVDNDGIVVGISAGHAIVQASVPGGVVATAPVEVAAAEFTLAPANVVLAPEEIDTFAITVPSQGNRELLAGIQWRVSVPMVARIGPTGILQALAPGQTEVIATGFFQERRVSVLVHRPVQTLVFSPRASAGPLRMPLFGIRKFSVQALAADSTPVPEAVLGWEVDDTTVATFDPSRLELSARKLGTTTLTLRTRELAPVTWAVEVVPGQIGLDRTRLALDPGQQVTLSGFLLNDDGSRIGPATELDWASDNTGAAVVGNDGVVEATGFGHARITATTRWGKSSSADVYVVGDLVFASNRSGGTFGIYQLSTRDPLRVVPVLADSVQNGQAAISPDRTRLVFSSSRTGDIELYLMNADGSNVTRLTEAAGPDTDPTWMPDGSGIVFSSGRSGVTQIYSVRPDGSGLLQLTSSGGGNSQPAVSPDGKTIAFVSTRDGNGEVYKMTPDGSNQVNVTGSREQEVSPRFFPNGDLAFAAEVRRRGYQVVRLPSDGSTPAAITTNPNPITSFAISRDGNQLAVVAGRVTDARRGRAQFTFSLEPAIPGGAVVTIPLVLNEQIATPSF